MIKELVVAEKEFKEYLTGKRFIALLAILLVLCVIGMIGGIESYNTQLDQYKATTKLHETDIGYRVQMQEMQKQLADLQASGAPQDQIDMMQSSLVMQDNSNQMPSMINIFFSITSLFALIGMALGVGVGFDLISKEKEEGSLKSLLSHPIFRDSVINGKAIAAILVLTVAITVTALLVIAILLLGGITPAGDDLLRIVAFFGATLLYCIVFLGISVMMSTLVKSSTMSILCILGIFLIAYSVPNISYSISSAILGPAPQFPPSPGFISVPPNGTVTIDGQTITAAEADLINMQTQQQSQVLQQKAQNDSNEYQKNIMDLSSLINMLSPVGSYQDLSAATINDQKPWDPTQTSMSNPMTWKQTKVSLWDSLGYKWGDLAALLLMAFAAFAVSYVAFLRTDIR
jgi:ABC-2 type transport system permease protein